MRVGCEKQRDDPWGAYERVGRETREATVRVLPVTTTSPASGCSISDAERARTLRHFLDEANRPSFTAATWIGDSIEWLSQNLLRR